MSHRMLSLSSEIPGFVDTKWFNVDSTTEEDKELWNLEQEIATELERIEQKYCEVTPIGKCATNEVKPIKYQQECCYNYVDEEEEEDEEEEDNDDEESESHEDDDDEEIDLDIEDQDSPTF